MSIKNFFIRYLLFRLMSDSDAEHVGYSREHLHH